MLSRALIFFRQNKKMKATGLRSRIDPTTVSYNASAVKIATPRVAWRVLLKNMSSTLKKRSSF
jgi:hypothetical protein